MQSSVHTVRLTLDWGLINALNRLDRFDASWSAIERREGQTLKQLKAIATVRSVGASTRIEGSRMSDEEVSVLLKNTNIYKLEERDAQEVVGYFQVLDTITDSYKSIDITENNIKGLHNHMMRFTPSEEWHRGNYKQHSNSVQASMPDGSKKIIFETTAPGFPTDDAMQSLVSWFSRDDITPPLIKCALFAYDFVSIHPFQDGNGRMSRLLSTLLLMRAGYVWIQYVSLEHEIENRKVEYYQVLQKCQAQRPNEDITPWLHFFLDALENVQRSLMNKLSVQQQTNPNSPREALIMKYIGNYPGTRSGQIAKGLDIPLGTVSRILASLVAQKLISKEGNGRATSYYLT